MVIKEKTQKTNDTLAINMCHSHSGKELISSICKELLLINEAWGKDNPNIKVVKNKKQIVHTKVNSNDFKHIKRGPTSFTMREI